MKTNNQKESTPSNQCNLSDNDLNTLRSYAMLSDVHINAANKLLRSQYPHIQGLQDPILGSKLQFDICRDKFCQILHDGSVHWLCVSNIFCDNVNDVYIYDSLQSVNGPNMHVKMQIASIMMLERPHINVIVQHFQQQTGSTDCGLFAIAAARSLCIGCDPSNLYFEQKKMREHFIMCLSKGCLNEFPMLTNKKNRRKPRIISVPLYCTCRMPDNGEERMIECEKCKEWFHQTCMEVPKSVFEDDESCWQCKACHLCSD